MAGRESLQRKGVLGSHAQRLSPRRKRSHWTELNKQRCRELEIRGLMTQAETTSIGKDHVKSYDLVPEFDLTVIKAFNDGQ